MSTYFSCCPGGCSPGKCIPLLGWHCQTPTISGTRFAKPYPYWHINWAFIHTLTGINPQKGYPLWQNCCYRGLLLWLLVCCTKISANLVQFFTFCTLPGTTTGRNTPSLAHIWCSKPYPLHALGHIAWKPYPLWHWNWPKGYPPGLAYAYLLPSIGVPPWGCCTNLQSHNALPQFGSISNMYTFDLDVVSYLSVLYECDSMRHWGIHTQQENWRRW